MLNPTTVDHQLKPLGTVQIVLLTAVTTITIMDNLNALRTPAVDGKL